MSARLIDILDLRDVDLTRLYETLNGYEPMSLLTHTELVRLIADESLVSYEDALLPFPLEQVNGASVDLTLGDEVLIESGSNVIDLARKQAPMMRRLEPNTDGSYELRPGDFVLAHTREVFKMPANVAGHYMLKSSLARAGLQHLFAGFADPTWQGCLTLELCNATRDQTLVLRPGQAIGQMVFFRGSSAVPEAASYARRGQYQGDRTVTQSKGLRCGA